MSNDSTETLVIAERARLINESRALVVESRDALRRALDLRGIPILTGSTSQAIALALEAVEEAMR